ncbi:ureidoglycolate lyase [Paradevosia shaoguanensis]|uniref:ureidoglycolate lyase n=1 Tax=Paradevosia shaoguanensis TaxID=1335043 RepID=UPI003C76F919
MTRRLPVALEPTLESFAPFGTLIERPAAAGSRQFYSNWLGGTGLAPVFHVNHIPPVTLPTTVGKLERHPHAAQCFVPLDVSRYLVTVAGSMGDGRPDLDAMRSYILPGSLGVIYAPGVWHAGASVLDRTGAFAVLMWRGANNDDVFIDIEPVQLISEGASR